MALTKGFIQNAATGPLDARFFTAGLVVTNSDNSPRTGVLYGTQNTVTGNANMTVTVASGVWLVLSRGTSDGASIVKNNGAASVSIAAAPSANSRYDVVWAKLNDSMAGDADSSPVFGLTSGTAAASPTVPSVPTGALALATVLVPSGVTSTTASGVAITNVAQFTALAGSPIRYATAAAMRSDATVPGGSFARVDGGGLFYLNVTGGSWVRVDQDAVAMATQTGASLVTGTTLLGLGGGSNAGFTTSDGGMFPARTDGLVLITVTGYYEVTGNVSWASSSTGSRNISICQNDNELTIPIADRRTADGRTDQSAQGQALFNAGDLVKLKGWQNSGGSLTYSSRLTVRLARV